MTVRATKEATIQHCVEVTQVRHGGPTVVLCQVPTPALIRACPTLILITTHKTTYKLQQCLEWNTQAQ